VISVTRSIRIDRPPEEVFALVDAPERYPEFFRGITRWESRSKRKKGVGARYRVLMKVGSIEAGGTIVVTERIENRVIAWTSEVGIEQEGRWDLKPLDGTATEASLEVTFDLSGGIIGALVERMTARIVARNLWATLLAARRLVEEAALVR
jgi:ribosome-associated toxin RatA of RatAB toxin-antitoxin module